MTDRSRSPVPMCDAELRAAIKAVRHYLDCEYPNPYEGDLSSLKSRLEAEARKRPGIYPMSPRRSR